VIRSRRAEIGKGHAQIGAGGARVRSAGAALGYRQRPGERTRRQPVGVIRPGRTDVGGRDAEIGSRRRRVRTAGAAFGNGERAGERTSRQIVGVRLRHNAGHRAAQGTVASAVGDVGGGDGGRASGHVHIRDAQLVHARIPLKCGSNGRGRRGAGFHRRPDRAIGETPANHHPVNPRERPIRRGERQRERRVVRVEVAVDPGEPRRHGHVHAVAGRDLQVGARGTKHAVSDEGREVLRPVGGGIHTVAVHRVEKSGSLRHTYLHLSLSFRVGSEEPNVAVISVLPLS